MATTIQHPKTVDEIYLFSIRIENRSICPFSHIHFSSWSKFTPLCRQYYEAVEQEMQVKWKFRAGSLFGFAPQHFGKHILYSNRRLAIFGFTGQLKWMNEWSIIKRIVNLSNLNPELSISFLKVSFKWTSYTKVWERKHFLLNQYLQTMSVWDA